MKNYIKMILCCFIILLISACTLFEPPIGSSEIISSYNTDSSSYLYLSCVVKITNNGTKTIYSSTINLQADSTLRTYYKTYTSSTTINPGQSIYVTVDFSIEKKETDNEDSESQKESETWKLDSVTISEIFFN